MSEPIEVALSCVPVSRSKQRRCHIARFTPPAGSIKGRCHTCSAEVWIGPKQQEMLAEDPRIEIVCSLCTRKQLADGQTALGHLGGSGGTFTMTNGRVIAPGGQGPTS